MAEPELVIVGELDLVEADLARAVGRLPEMNRGLIWLGVFGVGCLISVLVNGGVVWGSLGPCLIFIVVFSLLQLRARKAWPKRALLSLGAGRTTFRFDDFGVSVESSLRQQRLGWTTLGRYHEAPETFFVYTTPRTLFVLPKRAFAEADIPRIAELLKARVTRKPGFGPGAPLKRLLLLWLALALGFWAIWWFLNDAGRPSSPGSSAPGSSANR